MLSKLIICVVVITSVTMVFDGCNLTQRSEYNDIAEEITNISCPLSISNLEVQSNRSNRNYSEIVHSFDATCRRHIDVLAFKHQLQNMLFSINETLGKDTALQISSLIVYLQTAAMKLQSIRKQLQTCCVTFTAEQYELLYFSRLHKNNTFSSLCEKARDWQNKNEVCSEWTNYM